MRLAAEEHVCLLTVHHIVTDWVSFQLFWRELAALYQAARRRRGRRRCRSCRCSSPTSRSGSASWLQGEVLERLPRLLAPAARGRAAVLELPIDRPRPAMQTLRGARAVRCAPAASDGAAARRSPGARASTPFMAVLAGFKALLLRSSGQEKVIVGSPIGQPQPAEIEPMLGFFLTQLVFCDRPVGRSDFRELLAPGARGGARRLRAPGPAVRQAGRGPAAGARPAGRRSSRSVFCCSTRQYTPTDCRASSSSRWTSTTATRAST